MTLQTTGSISFSNITSEFGGSGPVSLSGYYSLDSGIPSSGTIKFSDFYGKILNTTQTFATNVQNINLRTSFSSGASIIGAKKSLATVVSINQPTKHYVIVGSGVVVGSTSTGSYSMVTGTWPTGSSIYLTNNGFIVGAGGAGGNRSGGAGGAGGNALNATAPMLITNNGTIAGGGGGGGAGSDASQTRCREEAHCYQRCYTAFASGGGGGGGAGNNVGAGGAGGNNGSSGTLTTGGAGGPGFTATDTIASATSSGGGAGGNLGSPGVNSAGLGGAAGFYLIGSSNVTWLTTGTRAGSVA